ncbi:hypothetical protein F5Y16DRAFT_415990 [Xylariaceae sp. FL0255]|nr:hypothetical protein F5Y16DRAFT_415990 [Xylariaceae sp. FL0255]
MGSQSIIEPVLNVPVDLQASLLRDRTSKFGPVPELRLNTVQHRQGISNEEQINFRVKLLRVLRQGWKDDETESKFFEALSRIKSDGCALFGGLINPTHFRELVDAYDKVQLKSGNNAFMHSYVNLGPEHDFLLGGDYVEAFSHPLLVALIAYLVGGAIRIVEMRGKNTDPISINAQDNMLHVDNTPFKEEYKVLLNWKRGEVKGPSGQNFTFLPWTHKGNREINVDQQGSLWSSERDSLFVTDEAIDGLFDFQNYVKGTSRVVEAKHPEQPLAVLFPAGALVHHRYRREDGDPRSCIIAAFHLSKTHPGQTSELPLVPGQKKNLFQFLIGYQDGNSNDEFLELLLDESCHIESKLQELFHTAHPSQLIDIAPLALEVKNNIRLSGTNFGDLNAVVEKVAAVMDYDKHCNLQMILYSDGREEIRKPGRKIIGERKKPDILARLKPWVPELQSGSFTADDLIDPKTLRIMADAVAALATNLAETANNVPESSESSKTLIGRRKIFTSLSRLMTDLGEAILRCEGVEAFVVTSLFLFLTAEEIYSHLSKSDKLAIRFVLVLFLKNYVATVLLVEANVAA